MTGFGALADISQTWLWHACLIFLRVGAAMSLIPGFGEQSVPVRVKLALAAGLTMALSTMIAPVGGEPWEMHTLTRFLVTETVAGLLFGVVLRLFVMTLQTAGTIAAQSTSLSQILGNAGEPMPAIGHLFVIAGLALAMAGGFHIKIVLYLAQSYDLLPAGQLPTPALVSEWGTARVAAMFSLAFRLAAPFVIVALLYNLTLGVINRAMPQLMVSFVGAPLITLGGLALFALLVPSILIAWAAALNGFLLNPVGDPR